MGNRQEMPNLPQHSAPCGLGPPKVSPRPPLRSDQRNFRAILVFLFVLALCGLALLPVAPPSFSFGLQTCAFKGATGLPCPLCGGTRAAQALLRGDFVRAHHLNMAALPILVAMVAGAIALTIEAMRGRVIINGGAVIQRLRGFLPALGLLFFLYWIVHLAGAVRNSKLELVDLHNPIARSISQCFSDSQK
jgi:Protein of unknown function (DUF2752)